jgi:hypothetical protein
MTWQAKSVTACNDERQDSGLVMPTIRALAGDAVGGIWVGSKRARARSPARADCAMP